MKEVLHFLKDNAPFYLATVDGDKPKVRPFGFVMEHEGKLWFCTSNKKNVYKQLQTNPYIEISTTAPDRTWIRLRGKAVFGTTRAVKAKALELTPVLKSMYSVEDTIFELFYLEEGEATFCKLTGEPIKTVRL
jgi:uncharacterized pyridoxamine 5'-phosphate oxidase family protein